MKLTVDRELRIGFIFQQSTWLGGLNYFRNLLTAIRSLPDGKLVPVVLVGTRSDVENQFPRLEIIKTPLLDRRSPSWIARKVISRTTSGDILLKSFLRKHNIQAISHSGHLGGQSEIATVGWIPDFQHVHLPNLFDTSEIQMRDVLRPVHPVRQRGGTKPGMRRRNDPAVPAQQRHEGLVAAKSARAVQKQQRRPFAAFPDIQRNSGQRDGTHGVRFLPLGQRKAVGAAGKVRRV